jgi:uncharacterized phage infection (PIP) family protein YhgE
MSNIYILSNELCDFCNVPHGTRMHIKQIVRKIEDYIKKTFGGYNSLYKYLINPNLCKGNFLTLRDYIDMLHNGGSIRLCYFDDKLLKIFSNIPNDNNIIERVNSYLKEYEKDFKRPNNDYNKMQWHIDEYNNKVSWYKKFTHNFDDIDMYLEMSGHLTPVLQQDINVYFNKVSSKIDNVKQEFTDTLNKISNKIDNVKSLVSFSNDAENELIEVNKLLKELEEMYNSK